MIIVEFPDCNTSHYVFRVRKDRDMSANTIYVGATMFVRHENGDVGIRVDLAPYSTLYFTAEDWAKIVKAMQSDQPQTIDIVIKGTLKNVESAGNEESPDPRSLAELYGQIRKRAFVAEDQLYVATDRPDHPTAAQ